MIKIHLVVDEKDEGLLYDTLKVPSVGELIHINFNDVSKRVLVNKVDSILTRNEDGKILNHFKVGATTLLD